MFEQPQSPSTWIHTRASNPNRCRVCRPLLSRFQHLPVFETCVFDSPCPAKDALHVRGASLLSPCAGLQRCRPLSGGTIHRRPAAAARWLLRPGRWSMLAAIGSGPHHMKPLMLASATTVCSQMRTLPQFQWVLLGPALSGRLRAQGRRRHGRNLALLRPRQMQLSALPFRGLLGVRGRA
jgi:hypothetical protein